MQSNGQDSPWGESTLHKLRALHDTGASASQIASMLTVATGHTFTRSAVIGKLHRLGLSCRYRPLKTQPSPRKSVRQKSAAGMPASVARVPAAKKQHVPSALSSSGAVSADERAHRLVSDGVLADARITDRKTIYDLEDDTCHWPIGDPRDDDFGFCGRASVPGLSYCRGHAERAYQPADAYSSRKNSGVKNQHPQREEVDK